MQVRYLFNNDITNGKEAVPVVGVNDWDEDRLVIGDCDTPAEKLPLKLDEHGCPALQVSSISWCRLADPQALTCCSSAALTVVL